ncbi:MAG: sugar phosphate nucleotidyltransferase [Leptospiraceae bacterium]|nr:sugar phosphate nucleotidyltransferase [Leptospiraceae bacterium]MDW7975961.1 mannose-1-phosphate guanylyltransferase [Leptospiraceae bacterium]
MKKHNSKSELPIVVIMAGGKGERFWPKSTESKPKQLQKIYSHKTLLEETLQRAYSLTEKELVFIGCNKELKKAIQKELGLKDKQFIVEPFGKNTAPIVALSSLILEEKYPDRVHVVLSADHYIYPLNEFKKTIQKAIELAKQNYLVTCGIIPTRPEIGYGYIQKGNSIQELGYYVTKFHEKPEISKALEYVKKGFYWNSGIFIWKGKKIIEAFEQYAGEILQPIREGYKSASKLQKAFESIPELPIDIAIMEKAKDVAVVESSFVWDDVGSWLSLERIYQNDKDKTDDKQNILLLPKKAHHLMFDSHNNIVSVETPKFIAFLGMENVVIVETEKVLFVAKKDRLSDIKNLIKEIKQNPTLHPFIK